MIYAMFATVLLTFAVAIYLFRLRLAAVKKGEVKLSYFRLYTGANISDKLLQASRNYSNLFEVPLLFYMGSSLLVALNLENIASIILSWAFVATRIAHSWIHLTSNNVLHRLKAFMLGNICVLLIWVILVWQYTARH